MLQDNLFLIKSSIFPFNVGLNFSHLQNRSYALTYISIYMYICTGEGLLIRDELGHEAIAPQARRNF